MTCALTYNDMLGAYSTYPAPIRPYLLRAETHPLLRSLLTKSFMRVFIDILGRAPIADPLRPLKLRMDVVADDLDISAKTVSRAISFMRQKGWLNQDGRHDGRNAYGEFSAREFLLGAELRHMLGLPTDVTPALPHDQQKQPVDNAGSGSKISLNTVDNSVTGTKMSHGLYSVNKVFKKEASFKEEASQLKNQKINPQNNQAPAKPQQPKLPADLTEMAVTLNIHPSGICSLMRMAKQANQRLQDVWCAKRAQLLNSGVMEGRAFRYIQFLLSTGEDFSFRARNVAIGKSKPRNAITPSAVHGAQVADFHLYLNKKYVGANGLRVRIHGDGSAEIQSATRNPSYVCPGDMSSVYEAIRNNKLWLVKE